MVAFICTWHEIDGWKPFVEEEGARDSERQSWLSWMKSIMRTLS